MGQCRTTQPEETNTNRFLANLIWMQSIGTYWKASLKKPLLQSQGSVSVSLINVWIRKCSDPFHSLLDDVAIQYVKINGELLDYSPQLISDTDCEHLLKKASHFYRIESRGRLEARLVELNLRIFRALFGLDRSPTRNNEELCSDKRNPGLCSAALWNHCWSMQQINQHYNERSH